jgi:type III pantothenate kinase
LKTEKRTTVNLVIDQGNTLTKLAIFGNNELIAQSTAPNINSDLLNKFIRGHGVSKAILSSVRTNADEDFEMLQTVIPQCMLLNTFTKLPFAIDYQTPETLGKDRIAAVAGALGLYPNRNILVIDAGTAITYEIVTDTHIYLGGNIAPGLQMRFKALHHFTQKLPLVEANHNAPLYGISTQTAIEAGVLNGMVFEIEGYISHLTSQYNQLLTVITGGDAEFFAGTVKNTIFVHPNLVVEGLNRILNYNV